MSYSVEAGPINFGSTLPGQTDELETGPFLDAVTAADALLAEDAAETIEAQGMPGLHEAVGQAKVMDQTASGINLGSTPQQPHAQPQLHAGKFFQEYKLASDEAHGEQAQHASCSGAKTPVSNSSTRPEAAVSRDKGVSSPPGQLRAEHLPDAEAVHETAASPANQPTDHCKRLEDQGAALAVPEHGLLDSAGGCCPAEGLDVKQETPDCTDGSVGAASVMISTAPALAAAGEHASSASNNMTVLPGSFPR